MNHRTLIHSPRGRLFVAAALVFSLCFGAPVSAGVVSTNPAYVQFMEDGGDWLLPLQQPDGSFPWTSTVPGSIFINVQAPIGFGLLSASQATGRADFLDAAIDVADYLIANQAQFTGGDPVFRSYDAYFLVRLSTVSGVSTYADHVQTFLWDRLQAGTYGPSGDWDIVDYVASEIARRGGQAPVGEVVAAWDLALIAVAADEAGIGAFDNALMAGIRQALEDAPDDNFVLGSSGYDVLGLTGGVWAGGLTGQSAVPAAGQWSGASGNLDLAQILLSYQSDQGAFLQSSQALANPIDVENTVSQHTAFAMLALQAFGGQQFAPELRDALDALIAFQMASGKISYYHPDVDLSTVSTNGDVLTHAYALQAFAEIQDAVTPGQSIPVPVMSPAALALLVVLMALVVFAQRGALISRGR